MQDSLLNISGPYGDCRYRYGESVVIVNHFTCRVPLLTSLTYLSATCDCVVMYLTALEHFHPQ